MGSKRIAERSQQKAVAKKRKQLEKDKKIFANIQIDDDLHCSDIEKDILETYNDVKKLNGDLANLVIAEGDKINNNDDLVMMVSGTAKSLTDLIYRLDDQANQASALKARGGDFIAPDDEERVIEYLKLMHEVHDGTDEYTRLHAALLAEFGSVLYTKDGETPPSVKEFQEFSKAINNQN